MEFIATYWWIWLIAMFVCYGYGVYNQLRRMKNLSEGKIDNFTDGMGRMIVAMLGGTIFTGMLLISVVINLIDYVKTKP